MSVKEKLTAIADEIRNYGNIDGEMNLVEMADNVSVVFWEGYAECDAHHTARYVTAFVTGDGTNTITFAVPFNPDCFFVTAHGASAVSANAVQQMVFDARSFARYGGMYRIRRNGSNTQGTMSSATGGNFFRWANNTCTIECPSALNVSYASDAQYICTAVKYTDKTDKELLEEEIAMLTNEAKTIEFSKARINATVTDAEWTVMIAHLTNVNFAVNINT